MAGETILLVDDEQHIIELAQMYLEKEGYVVRSAGDGQRALDLVARERPDLVVLALELPDLHGLDVCRRLRRTSNVPVVMVGEASAPISRSLVADSPCSLLTRAITGMSDIWLIYKQSSPPFIRGSASSNSTISGRASYNALTPGALSVTLTTSNPASNKACAIILLRYWSCSIIRILAKALPLCTHRYRVMSPRYQAMYPEVP